MSHAPLLQPGNESPGYYVPAADASTQTTEEDFIFLDPTQDTSTQTTEEDFLLLKPEACTQTAEGDFDLLSQIHSTSNVSNVTTQETLDTSKTLESGNLVGIQFVDVRDEKTFRCKVCDKDLEVHAKMYGRKMYFCCVCNYKTVGKPILQQHVDIHCARNICNKCTREYTEGDLHYTENACCFCKKEFDCKTFLDLHYVNHETYFANHCWVCKRSIDKHIKINDGKTFYICCACGYKSYIYHSKEHNKTHCPKLFCIICKEEYPIKEKNWHGKEFTCILCKKVFQCHTVLEKHSEDHIAFFSLYCIICLEELHLHQDGVYFQCCVCKKFYIKQNLQIHLRTHTDIRLFKCDDCGKRLSDKSCLKSHLENSCLPLPEKCEICLARFPNRDSLEHHCSKNHIDLK